MDLGSSTIRQPRTEIQRTCPVQYTCVSLSFEHVCSQQSSSHICNDKGVQLKAEMTLSLFKMPLKSPLREDVRKEIVPLYCQLPGQSLTKFRYQT